MCGDRSVYGKRKKTKQNKTTNSEILARSGVVRKRGGEGEGPGRSSDSHLHLVSSWRRNRILMTNEPKGIQGQRARRDNKRIGQVAPTR